MEAPDKIFILYHKDFSDRRIFNAFTEKENDTDIEYIRKDVLVEWMDKNIKQLNVLYGEIFIARVRDILKLM